MGKLKIILAAVIFVCSASFTAVTAYELYDQKRNEQPSVSVPGEEDEAAYKIELHAGREGDNKGFNVENMMPGDTVTEYFCVKATHKSDMNVMFGVSDIKYGNPALDIMNITVTVLGETPNVIYNGSFAELPDQGLALPLSANKDRESVLFYQVDVGLPTTAGNECANTTLSATFDWYPADAEPADPIPDEREPNLPLLLCIASSVVLAASAVALAIFIFRKEMIGI